MLLKAFFLILLILYSCTFAHIHVSIRDGRAMQYIYNFKIGNMLKKDTVSQTVQMDSVFSNSPSEKNEVLYLKDFQFYKLLPSLTSLYYEYSQNSELLKKKSWILNHLHDIFDDNIVKFNKTNYEKDFFSQEKVLKSFTIPMLDMSYDCLTEASLDLPYGLCYQNAEASNFNKSVLQNYSKFIVDSKKLPHSTGTDSTDSSIAYGIVLLNCGYFDKSISHFTNLINENPDLIIPLYGRALAYIRKNSKNLGSKALNDLTKAIKINKKKAESWERRSDLYFLMGRLSDAHNDMNHAVSLEPTWRNLYVRGTIHFLLENFELAEIDFRAALHHKSDDPYIMLQLALSMYFRGHLRGSIELLKEMLQLYPNNAECLACLAQAYKQVGDEKRALLNYEQLLLSSEVTSEQRSIVYHAIATLYLATGLSHEAVAAANYCLEIDAYHPGCLYVRTSALTALGRFYDSIKSATTLMVQANRRTVRISPEFVRVHYLREWSRLVHSRLDEPMLQLNLSGTDFPSEYRDRWMKGLPIDSVPNYVEQPGLQPHIADVKQVPFSSYSYHMQELLCRAQSLGRMFVVSADGHYNNKRTLFALGLASLHTAQIVERYWASLSTNSRKRSTHLDWKKLLRTVLRYQTLAEPDEPSLLLSDMSPELLEEGYTTEKLLLRGQTENVKLKAYFDLVFQLVKTVAEHSSLSKSDDFHEEMSKINSPAELIAAAKRRGAFHPQAGGVLVITQVPSTKYKQSLRHDGAMITLSEDAAGQHQPLLSLNLLTTAQRLTSYNEELDFLMGKLTDDIMVHGSLSAASMAAVTATTNPNSSDGASSSSTSSYGSELVDAALQLHYYICNAGIITHSPGLVAYSVALGVLLALGLEARGPLPPGKLLELEPLLAGTPEAFVLVTRQWLSVGQIRTTLAGSRSITSLPDLDLALPTVRHVLEALAIGPIAHCQ